jgi:membrane protein EpsK
VGLVVLLFYAVSASIRYVGGAILCGTLVAAAGSVWLWRRLTPSLRITRRDFNWGVLKSLATTGGWMMVNQVGWILYMGIDVLVANRLCGAELAGKYAAVLALPLLIRTLSASIGIVFQPTLTYHYARNDIDGLVNYARHGVKCLGLMLALPIALMCAFPEQLLSSWLGPDFGEWSPLLFLMAAPLCLSMAVNPLLGLHLTADRMKVPGMFTLCIGLANVGLAVLLAAGLKWGLYGIAAAGAITITLRHALFTPIYAAHILHRPRATFLWEYTPILLVTVATILLGRAVASVWEIAGWGDLIAVGLGISVLYCAGVFGLVLNKDERQTLWNALRKR